MLRYGMLYGPGTFHDRRGSTAADIVAGRVPLVEGATVWRPRYASWREGFAASLA